MSSSQAPDFDNSNISLNSTMNDGYATADESVTRYYSTLEVTDTTIEPEANGITGTIDEKLDNIANDTAVCDDLNPNTNMPNEVSDVQIHENKLPSSSHEEHMDTTMEKTNEVTKLDLVVEGENEKDIFKLDETLENAVGSICVTNDEAKAADLANDKLENNLAGIASEEERNVLLHEIEPSEELFTDSEQRKASEHDIMEKSKLAVDMNKEIIKQENRIPIEKESENPENYVEEYLDEEYLEYETVEGEPVTGDSNPHDTIMTPSDSDDDDSDNSPVMAYLEKNENLNFYKNNPHAMGLPAKERHTEKTPLKKKDLRNQIASIANGMSSVLLKSSDTNIIRYKKINATGKSMSEPKYALIKEATMCSSIPRAKKLIYRSSELSNSMDIGNTKGDIPSIKKPRERKQILEPANVDVVFELEKVKEEEEAVRKAKKKMVAKNNKVESSSAIKKDVANPARLKRKWMRKSEPTKEEESPRTPPRQSKRLSKKGIKKKICKIASCKCDLQHVNEQSDDESEVDSNTYENTSDYSDEWQLSPKSISHTSPPKIKVYSNIRKRQHSHKSTFDDDEDDISNDLLTLIKEDEKSNKEIDLNKEFPEKKCTPVSTPVKKTKSSSSSESEELLIKDKLEETSNNTEDTVSSMINDDASLFSKSMTLINTEDEEEFSGFEPNKIPSRKSMPLIKNVSIFNFAGDSNDTKLQAIEEAKPTISNSDESDKKEPLTENSNKADKMLKRNVCSVCTKSFPLRVHLIVHEKTHKIKSTCRYCSETFSYPTALKEHVQKSCATVKETERNIYLEELNKMKIAPAIRPKGVTLKQNAPRRIKLLRKTPIKNHVKRKINASPLHKSDVKASKIAIKSKLIKTPLKNLIHKKLNPASKQQISNLDNHNIKVIGKQTAQRYSTMKRRSQSILQEINKTNNNVDVPTTSSQSQTARTYKCENCKLDFKTPTGLQKHKSTHKKVEMKCKKCKTQFRNHLLLSKHESSCEQSLPEKPSRRIMQVSELSQLLNTTKSNKGKPVQLRKLRAHSGVPLSSKMQKVFDNIKKDINSAH